MIASDEEMLTIQSPTSKRQVDEAYKEAALAYHPDKFSGLEELEKAILTRRMQEMNSARESLRKTRKS